MGWKSSIHAGHANIGGEWAGLFHDIEIGCLFWGFGPLLSLSNRSTSGVTCGREGDLGLGTWLLYEFNTLFELRCGRGLSRI